jgi:SAM-dependent methyltransferase
MSAVSRYHCASEPSPPAAGATHGGALEIPINEAGFMPTSGLDPTGKVFQYRDSIFRGIYAAAADFYRALFSGSFRDELIRAGLIDTQISPHRMQGFDLLVQQPLIPVVSYASEWSSRMLKDAAELTCNLEQTLRSGGYTLRDGHPWNILFDRCRPVFVDIGSIVEKQPSARSPFFLYDFRSTFLYPLLLNTNGLGDIAYAMMVSFLSTDARGTFDFPIFRLLLGSMPLRQWVFHRRRSRRIDRVWPRDETKGLDLLMDQIDAIDTDDLSGRDRAGTSRAAGPGTGDVSGVLHKALDDVMATYAPSTVLDIGAGSGRATEIALAHGARVIAADIDDAKVTRLYHRFRQSGGDVYPVRMDFCSPNMDHGPWAICTAATKRFRSQMVLLLNLIERLVQFRFLSFDRIARYLADFTQKWALVEFVGAQHPKLCKSGNRRITSGNYTIDALRRSLKRYFDSATVYTQIEPERWLLLCEDPKVVPAHEPVNEWTK